MAEKTGIAESLRGFLKTKKGQRFTIFLLALAAALLLLWDYLPGESGGSDAREDTTLSAEDYEEGLEKRLTDILSDMEGVGDCRVMVTIENTGETFYVTQGKNAEETDEKADGGRSESHQTEENYIIMENETGDQSALSRKTDSPGIRGVLVVCKGGASATVRARVTEAVSTALGIGADKVCVTGSK